MRPFPLSGLATGLALMVLASAGAPAAVAAQQPARRTVLAIHWGPEDFPITPEVNTAIQSALRSDPDTQVDYFVEHLESDAFPDDAAAALADYIRRKYQGRRIDVVIAIADPALRFALEHRAELFPGVPIVYSGVAIADDSEGAAPRGVTGVLRGIAYAQTLMLALELHPDTEQVVVVGHSPDAQVVASVKAELRDFSRQVRLSFLEQQTLPALLEAVRAVPPRSLILYIFFSEARPGTVGEVEAARLVASSASVPVYGTNERYVGTGIVGGVVRGTTETGVRVGELALAILRGAAIEDLPVEQARLVPTFDWRQLQRWRLAEARLPAGSNVQFRTLSAWESYRTVIVGGVIVVSAQTLLIAGLLAQRSRRRRAEATLQTREATLRASYERTRLLAGRVINAEEATRAGIARDLHDGVCQDLIGVSMAAASLKRMTGQIQDPDTQRALAMLHDDTREVSETLRQLSHDLHPATLQLVGLASSLKAHCTEVEQRHGVEVRFQAVGDFADVHVDVVVCLFRIAQESMRNAVIHGDATRLTISLERTDEQIELSITDNGGGFDVEAVRGTNTGLGLVSMEERARGVGAHVQIVSGVHQGTTVFVRGPVQPGASTHEL